MLNVEDLNELISLYGDSIFKYCLILSGWDRHLAEDVWEDVWLVVLSKRKSLKKSKYFYSYLRKTADRCMMENRRKIEDRRRHELSLEVLGYLKGAGSSVSDAYFEDAKDEESLLWDVMKMLPPDERELFKLRYIDLYSLTKISSLTGVPYSTVRLRLKKIEKKIVGLASQL